MILKWQPMYLVNIAEIDEQHKKLFEIEKNQKTETILKELEDYSKYHFSTEEKYFEKFNYPDKEIHKKIHQTYNKKIEEFKKRQKEDKLVLEVRDFLKNWWLNHIQTEDQKYSDFFNQNGLY